MQEPYISVGPARVDHTIASKVFIRTMSASAVPKLFQPAIVGKHALSHRIVLAPLTRFRADKNHVPSEHAPLYYAQRGSVPGTLLITEATFISPFAGGYNSVPGIWNEEQVQGWKRVGSHDPVIRGTLH